jgi:aconitate hydratase
MSPEYGATIAIFPIDDMTLDYLRLTGRKEAQVQLVEAYAKEQGLYRTDASPDATYDLTLDLDLSTIEPSLAGPKRPQDRVSLKQARPKFEQALAGMLGEPKRSLDLAAEAPAVAAVSGATPAAATGDPVGVAVAEPPVAALEGLDHGSVVIASITSCTNTSNPSVMIGAGLLAKKAVERGLRSKPWVKTSLAPGSQVVTDYLQKAGLTRYLDALGFNLVGYGCTTCIGNSGPLPEDVSAAVKNRNLVVVSVLSGNRNFEGRIQPQVRANYLASPPLVVAYALAGRMTVDLTSEPIGQDAEGGDVFLRDLWPSEAEIQETMLKAVRSEMFTARYSEVFAGDERWRSLPAPKSDLFEWDPSSTYVRSPPFFEHVGIQPEPLRDIIGATALAVLGDSVTTDHISPAGSIPVDSPAGAYLISRGVAPGDFNSYGARRGNHEVMMRGTFANIRLRNLLAPGTEGGWTVYLPDDELMTIYDAAMRYKEAHVPLVILAGKEYGSGSSRDWAAKGTFLLGVKAVVAESFERIHRSNLVNMGVLPLQFRSGASVGSLKLTGRETFEITGLGSLRPASEIAVRTTGTDGSSGEFPALVRIDTPEELIAFQHGGILPYVLRQLLKS